MMCLTVNIKEKLFETSESSKCKIKTAFIDALHLTVTVKS